MKLKIISDGVHLHAIPSDNPDAEPIGDMTLTVRGGVIVSASFGIAVIETDAEVQAAPESAPITKARK